MPWRVPWRPIRRSRPRACRGRLTLPASRSPASVRTPICRYEASRETPHQAISAALPIELGGKRQRRVDLAQATVAVGDADLARVIADVRREVRRAYFEAVAADTQAQIAEDVRALTRTGARRRQCAGHGR